MRSVSTRRYTFGAALAALAAGAAMLVPIAGASAQTVTTTHTRSVRPDAGQTIVNDASGICLDMTGRSKENNAPAQIYGCNGGSEQEWNLISVGNYVLIQNVNSEKCLSIYKDDKKAGGQVTQYDCNFSGGDHFELWDLESQSNGDILIGNLGDNLLVMHPSGCSKKWGTKIFMNNANDCYDNNLWS